MLRDITSTNVRVNARSVPFAKQYIKETAQADRRQVKFTEEGDVSHLFDRGGLMVAMVAAKNQAKPQRTAPRTLKKPKEPMKPMIGSLSPWRQDELDRFEVRVGNEVEVNQLSLMACIVVRNIFPHDPEEHGDSGWSATYIISNQSEEITKPPIILLHRGPRFVYSLKRIRYVNGSHDHSSAAPQ
jgi:hypothetical protein